MAKKPILLGGGLITSLDLSNYWGQAGATIQIATRNGHHDYGVKVKVKDVLGVLIEEGLATWDSATGQWCYITLAEVPLGEIWILTATAGNPEERTTREGICVPHGIHWVTEFKTNALVQASGLGRWKNN